MGSQDRWEGLDLQVEWIVIARILLKTILLFLCLNLAFAIVDPLPFLGRISAYNLIFPGRLRLPYGEDPERSYNLTLTQLDAMLTSHEISGVGISDDEYRVVFIGDSSTWGFLLQPDQTITSRISMRGERIDGRRIRAFNLGYPTMSITKDLLFLDRGLAYQPDFVVWLITLESLPLEKQLDSQLLQFNPDPTRILIERYGLRLARDDARFVNPTFWDRTLVGRRKQIADLFRFQMYGVLWASTSIDRRIPETYNRLMEDLEVDNTFYGLIPGELKSQNLALDVLAAGIQAAGDIPVLLVNEPIFISQGENSDIRYNFYYPRWAYDEFRHFLSAASQQIGWDLLDLWDFLPAEHFTDSAFHYSPEGAKQLADIIFEAIQERVSLSKLGKGGG